MAQEEKKKPTIEELEKAIGTPDELDILPDGSTRPKYAPAAENKPTMAEALGKTLDESGQPRRDEELKVSLAAIERVIVKDLLTVPPALAVYLPTIRDALKELMGVRKSLPCVGSKDFKEDCFALRAQIKETKMQTMLVFNEHPVFKNRPPVVTGEDYKQPIITGEQAGEMKANLMLAYRHLEDARMRLGKTIQAYDGGKSCYPR